jgi:hypothetical protein
MAKLPKFMVACDPVEDEDTEYIIHTRLPRLIALVLDDEEEDGTRFQVLQYIDDPVKVYGDGKTAELEKVMQEMETWYASYQQWLEKEDDDDDEL